MSDLTTEELARRIDELGFWFQNIRLKGLETNPSRPDHSAARWQSLEPYVPEDLTGKTVLDLGSNAGYFAIKMRERGAEVLGVDWYPEAIEQAKFAASVLDLEIDYRVANIYEFVLSTDTRFDYVVFMGVFYHLRYPLLVLDRLAELTRCEMFFQTIIRELPGVEPPRIPDDLNDFGLLAEPGFPSLYFIERNFDGAFNNWFVCNRSGIEAMLRSAGFRSLRSRGDVFACAVQRELRQGWRAAHSLSTLKLAEPSENVG